MKFIKKHLTSILIIGGMGLAGAILGLSVAAAINPAGATGNSCHWECSNRWYGICTDWDYVCPQPSPTATPEPTQEPTSSPEPSSEPTTTPEPTVEPTPVDTTDHTIRPAGAPQGPVCKKIEYAPTVLGYNRLSPTDVKVWWSKVDPFVNTYVVWFGMSKNLLTWNEVVTGNETTLHFLPASQPLWVGVQGLSDGCVGNLGEIVDP